MGTAIPLLFSVPPSRVTGQLYLSLHLYSYCIIWHTLAYILTDHDSNQEILELDFNWLPTFREISSVFFTSSKQNVEYRQEGCYMTVCRAVPSPPGTTEVLIFQSHSRHSNSCS
jgi:hypothetical protein